MGGCAIVCTTRGARRKRIVQLWLIVSPDRRIMRMLFQDIEIIENRSDTHWYGGFRQRDAFMVWFLQATFLYLMGQNFVRGQIWYICVAYGGTFCQYAYNILLESVESWQVQWKPPKTHHYEPFRVVCRADAPPNVRWAHPGWYIDFVKYSAVWVYIDERNPILLHHS